MGLEDPDAVDWQVHRMRARCEFSRSPSAECVTVKVKYVFPAFTQIQGRAQREFQGRRVRAHVQDRVHANPFQPNDGHGGRGITGT